MSVNYLQVGQQFRIVLPGNPTTGYTWQYTTIGDDALNIKGGFQSSNPGLTGAGGQFIFIGTAIAPGRETVVFTYARPWEHDPNPTEKTYNFSISH